MIFSNEISSLLAFWCIILLNVLIKSSVTSAYSSQYYHYTIDHHFNPYSQPEQKNGGEIISSNDTFILKKKIRKSASSPAQVPLKEWVPVNTTNNHTTSHHYRPHPHTHHVMIGYGKKPLSEHHDHHNGTTLATSGSNPQSISIIQSNYHRQPLVNQQYTNQESIDLQQEHPLPYYQCDSIIQDYRFIIESPEYPAQYPINRICSYYIGKNHSDICHIEIIISDMDIEDTAQCTADYLDLGSNTRQQERLCGLMLRNTRRIINFPPNATHIRITFHSDSKNDRPYRGFSAEVQQIPNSCTTFNINRTYPTSDGYSGPISPIGPQQQYPIDGGTALASGTRYPSVTQSQSYPIGSFNPAQGYKHPSGHYAPPGQKYPIGGVVLNPNEQQSLNVGGINTGYGQRLYPPRHPPYFQQRPDESSGGTLGPGGSGVIYSNKVPSRSGSGFGGNQNIPQQPNITLGPIYLASYCDVYLGEFNGEIRSPGYPFGYPINHSCIYTIKKASDDVCQLELVFHHFDIQTPNTQKDLTDNCQGDYLQMPDSNRLCGYYTQSMSGDYKLKKYYAFPESSEYVFMHFFSDDQQTPDGSGFWLEVKQLPNTCSINFDYRNARCDQVVSGRYSTVERIYSPNFPQFYGSRQQCVYFIQPMDEKTCEFELDLVQFSLEQPSKQDGNECRKDFLQLPDRRQICGHHKFRKIFKFPKYHDRISMFYFHSDEQIEDRGFEIIVRQIPNSCDNYSFPIPNKQPSPWHTNVYVPTDDPNLSAGSYLPPTPIFTYDNKSGLQPYQPPLKSPTGSIYPSSVIGGPSIVKTPSDVNFGRKSFSIMPSLPSYWIHSEMPNILNDPKNVDSSGTIPLYFANGTLATRIPPMKPVDMIPFLKKGKTIVQKGSTGRLFPTRIGSPQDVSAIAFNRFPSPTSSPEPEFQSSARLRKDDPHVERLRSFDQIPASADNMLNVMPSYSCDKTITRPVEYIRSPNFPNNYPIVTRCIYSIIKSDMSVCQIHLHLLSLDLEYTSGCRNDYLQIEPTGEKLCGRFNQPEVRVINYYGYSRDIRLIFNSDRQTTSSGFEVRIEQVANSCDDLRPNVTLNAMMIGGRNFHSNALTSTVTMAPLAQTTPFERLRFDSSASAQALTISNQTTVGSQASSITTLVPVMGENSGRICQTTSVMESYLESENFPLEYPSNLDCLYKVFRANRNVCRLEIEFEHFNIGDENNFGSTRTQFSDNLTANQQRNRPIGECLNDFFEIDTIRYCGQRSGQQVAINFPKFLNEITFRFVSANTAQVTRFNGFRIKVQQIDENCRSSLSNQLEDGEIEREFTPAIIESCPKLALPSNTSSLIVGLGSLMMTRDGSKIFDPSSVISEEVIKIQSPQFGLPSSLQYEPFLDCHYVIQKTNRNVCALEIRFEIFSLEESRSCTKDYLEINQMLRLCGKLPMDTTRVFDFFDERMLIHFHTDSDLQEQGFAMILKQIRC